MELKIVDGQVALQETEDGKKLPVYVTGDGKEIPFDAAASMDKIKTLNGESASRRLRIEELEKQMNQFDGFDIEKAKKAMETVANFDDKKLVDAGEIEKLKEKYTTSFEQREEAARAKHLEEMKRLNDQIEDSQKKIRNLVVTNHFSKSPYFTGEKPKTILPPDMAAEYFGKYFEVKEVDGDMKLIGKRNGEIIVSEDPKNFGSPAPFDEAIAHIIDNYPMRDRILRTAGGGSGGSGNADMSIEGDVLVLSKADAMDPIKYRKARAKAAERGVELVIKQER